MAMAINKINNVLSEMDLGSLKYFFIIASFGGFSKAARASGISQPALSLGLKKIEQKFGVALIRRDGARFELTSQGVLLFDFCTRLEEQYGDILARIQAREHTAPRRVRLGTALSIGYEPFTEFCKDLTQQSAALDLEIVERKTHDLLDDVADGRLEGALVPDDVHDERLAYSPLIHDEVIYVVSALHAAPRQKFEKEQLVRTPLVNYPRETPMRSLVDRLSAKERLSFRVQLSASSIEGIRTWVIRGVGGAFILRSLVEEDLRAGTLVAPSLPISLPKSGVALVTRRDKQGKSVSGWLMESFRSNLRKKIQR